MANEQSQQYDNEMRGALFPEDKGRYRNPATAPDYTGYVQIEGQQYRLAGWVKNRRTGKVLSLSVSVKQENTEQTMSTDAEDFLNATASETN